MPLETVNRDIQVLSEKEHLRSRPEMYISSVNPTEEKVPIIEDDKIVNKIKIYSVGMYRLFQEVLDNSFDEAKRCFAEKRPMTNISVYLDTQTNEIKVSDTGFGFKNADKINHKSKKTNVETAVSELRAGSNFNNDDTQENIIGTNGVGVSIVNALSKHFSITTNNEKIYYHQEWDEFIPSIKDIRKSKKSDRKGTTVSFIPTEEVFKNEVWDIEMIKSKLIFKNFLKNNSKFKTLILDFYIDGHKQKIDIDFLQDMNTYRFDLKNKDLKVITYPIYPGSTSISFINDSLCTGLHQKVVNEILNDKVFQYDKANQFYEAFIMLNLPPKFVKFGDQNKTKFSTTRQELEPLLKFNITSKDLQTCKQSFFFSDTKKLIEEANSSQEMKKLKKAKKDNKIKISEKFYHSKRHDQVYITEGLSASGSILQVRDPNSQAIYALRGKIKNVHTITDLSSNQEVMELINILDLDVADHGDKCKYNKIIIGSDADEDGTHLAGLLINFFYKWFPNLVKYGKLYRLQTPLISIDIDKNKKYFYSFSEYEKSKVKGTNVRYFKGLGSLSIPDWEFVFKNLRLVQIKVDPNSDKYIDMAFGNNSDLRKSFLQR